MEIRYTILLIIFGSALVTFIPRVLPLMVLSRIQLPDWAISWLKHVPVAVMAALLAQSLLFSNDKLALYENSLNLVVALPVFLVAIFTRSLLGTVLTGIICMMLLRFIF
ncbi:AzlD domain-containing protein [Heyndrickxia vini]|uniref:AzlD domain-containing protein n=1 Tax=Heyndrickxia vini TaxID=1476025 RepID=A0ABX7E373_9BACI|nr:AzlD domain-containing protein [Heyndrickxia vini]QQZ09689.1 AzlD domain-containing protein [Heyndrickxia vini]